MIILDGPAQKKILARFPNFLQMMTYTWEKEFAEETFDSALLASTETGVIMLGSWISTQLEDEAFYNEYYYGMRMQFAGFGIIAIDSQTDDPVEVEYLREYNDQYKYWQLVDTANPSAADDFINNLVGQWVARGTGLRSKVQTPKVIGDPDSNLLIVAPSTGTHNMPFMYKSGLELVNALGPAILDTTIVTQGAINPAWLKDFPIALAFGGKASTWARFYARVNETISLPLPHQLTEEDITFLQKTLEKLRS